MRQLSDATIRISSYTGLLVRSIELCCGAILYSAELKDKISAGIFVGKLGYVASLAYKRMEELRFGQLLIESSAAEALDRIARDLHPTEAISAIQSLVTSISARNASRDEIIDQPSQMVYEIGATTFHIRSSPDQAPAFEADKTTPYTGNELIAAVPVFPARPRGMAIRTDRPINFDARMKTVEGRCSIIHDICIDVEICASEVCAMTVLLYRKAPLLLKLDMARQVWDEARHAELALERFEQLGGESSKQTYTFGVIQRWRMGGELSERLAVQQVLSEGNALDGVTSLAAAFAAAGDHETSRMFEFFTADEEAHVRFGNRWIRQLARSEAGYNEIIQRMSRRLGIPIPGFPTVNVPSRRNAGFTDHQIELMVEAQRNRPITH
ncbi:DUF455 family protein [Caulobacter segnis]|uniref:DUF455 family protein n=1 Tax=Caulobacter segnis TaxID=88688 RepID=UPI0024106EF3|nr:DUF455 family protein [Caulobacter segnis]MDG2520820.1 DUF455 family protein [Caulobacter segnis]